MTRPRPGASPLGRGHIAPPHGALLHDRSIEDQEASAIAFWLDHWQSGKLPSLI